MRAQLARTCAFVRGYVRAWCAENLEDDEAQLAQAARQLTDRVLWYAALAHASGANLTHSQPDRQPRRG